MGCLIYYWGLWRHILCKLNIMFVVTGMFCCCCCFINTCLSFIKNTPYLPNTKLMQAYIVCSFVCFSKFALLMTDALEIFENFEQSLCNGSFVQKNKTSYNVILNSSTTLDIVWVKLPSFLCNSMTAASMSCDWVTSFSLSSVSDVTCMREKNIFNHKYIRSGCSLLSRHWEYV